MHDDGDNVVEAAGGGIDLVKTIVDGLVLAANVENLTLQGAAVHGAGNTLANYITGNGLGNSLAGRMATTRSMAAPTPTIGGWQGQRHLLRR